MNEQKTGVSDRESGSFGATPIQPKSQRLIGIAVLLAAALIAIAPQLFLGNSCGHDFDFHLVSWLDAQHSWRQGILYPRWAPSANYGAGEPRFIFYPPLSWMLGAALGFVFPWKAVSIAMTYLFLAGTGLATRALARQKLNEGMATLAGCAALFSGYALFTAYERSDFGELAGGFWIPLLLLFVLRDRLPDAPILRRAFDGSTVPLAIVLAGAWLSNAPLGVMASYLLAAFTFTIAVARRSSAPLLRAATSASLGLGLAAVYILPAAYEQRWVDIRQAVNDPGYQFQNSWLFARHTDPALEEHDLELLKVSAIGTTMLAIAISCILIAWARGRFHGAIRWWISLALIPFAVLLLQFPISSPLWRTLPEFRFLQFPWRWLVVAEAPMGVFFAPAVWFARRNWRVASLCVCGAVFLVGTGAAAFSFFQDCDEEDAVSGMLNVYRAGTGFEGADEYAPLGADNSIVPIGVPAACLAASPSITLGEGPADTNPPWNSNQGRCLQTFAPGQSGQPSSDEHLRIDADIQQAGFLILRLRRYPAWQIRVNGSLIDDLPKRADGLLAVPVPQDLNRLTVDWTTTSDVRLGQAISLLSLLLLTALSVFERRQNRARLSLR
jgi:hypothetical protein